MDDCLGTLRRLLQEDCSHQETAGRDALKPEPEHGYLIAHGYYVARGFYVLRLLPHTRLLRTRLLRTRLLRAHLEYGYDHGYLVEIRLLHSRLIT